jgi:hypothetical protein
VPSSLKPHHDMTRKHVVRCLGIGLGVCSLQNAKVECGPSDGLGGRGMMDDENGLLEAFLYLWGFVHGCVSAIICKSISTSSTSEFLSDQRIIHDTCQPSALSNHFTPDDAPFSVLAQHASRLIHPDSPCYCSSPAQTKIGLAQADPWSDHSQSAGAS